LSKKNGNASMIRQAVDTWVEEDQEDVASDFVVQHRDWVSDWLDDERATIQISEARLHQMAMVAAFSPAVSVWRAVSAVFEDDVAEAAYPAVVSLCLGSMRRYFNRPYVQQIIRQHGPRLSVPGLGPASERGFALQTIVYAADAHLQAVLDEFLYLISDLGVEEAIRRLADIWGLSQGNPRTNGPIGNGSTVRVRTDHEPHATHFALAFGEDVSRDVSPGSDEEKVRKSVVREAFNSPFWPFVLATTSVGQEGLDFHLYCRDVMHWNLPSNPVDLEQREGRINRRDCLAVRQSVAVDWPVVGDGLWAGSKPGRNPWPVVFGRIEEHHDLQKYKHGLYPHWVYECRDPKQTVRIRRHVPFFSTSRDAMKYERLKTGLALYRLVFGQVNQEDLLTRLQGHVAQHDPGERARILKRLASYMLNLSPLGHVEAIRHAEEEADALLAAHPRTTGLKDLLTSSHHLLGERPEELAEVASEVRDLVNFVDESLLSGKVKESKLRQALAALSYLRNPYDRVFDLQVEGGFLDDIAVIREAWEACVGK
jgi:hypothetical protein